MTALAQRAGHAAGAPGWLPTSPCGDGCLPAEGGRAALPRLAALLAVVLIVAASAPVAALLPAQRRSGWLRAAARVLLAAARVQVDVVGAPSFGTGGVLVVANHVSWVEVLALATVAPVRFVAKREIARWPVVGSLARAGGAVFVDRGRPSALPGAVAEIGAALRAGHAVAVFPEGTTWCGAAAGTFRRAAFQAAVDAVAPVRPVAVTLLTRDGRPARAAAFVGDEHLLGCLSRIVRLDGLVCRLTVLPVLDPGADRAALARRAGEAIAAVTGVPHPSRGPVDPEQRAS